MLPGAVFAQVVDATPVTQDALTTQLNALKLELIGLLTEQLHALEAQLEAQISAATNVSTSTPVLGAVQNTATQSFDLHVNAEVGTENGFLHNGYCETVINPGQLEGSKACPNDAGWVYFSPNIQINRARIQIKDANKSIIGMGNYDSTHTNGVQPTYLIVKTGGAGVSLPAGSYSWTFFASVGGDLSQLGQDGLAYWPNDQHATVAGTFTVQ